MSEDFEGEFQQVAQRLLKKKRQAFAQRIAAFLFLLVSICGGISLLVKGGFSAGSGVAMLGWLFLGGIGTVFALGWLGVSFPMRSESPTATPKALPGLHALGRMLHRLRSVKRKYIFGYALLALALIFQRNPSLLTGPFENLILELRYRPTPPLQSSPWPWTGQETIHPLIRNLPPDAEQSLRSVAAYISQREPNPYAQVKAIHDYVITRVTYDKDVLTTGLRPRQDADTVFKTGRAVCEGYAKLFAALGQEMGLDVVTVGGKVRRDLAPVDVIPGAFRVMSPNYDWTLHAWNAVKVNGQWQIVDTTWDDADEASLSYSADYLMPAPKVMIVSHLPDRPAWQLLTKKKSQASFEEQPLLTPQFFKEGLQVNAPQTYTTTVVNEAIIEIVHSPHYQNDIEAFFTSKRKQSLWSILLSSKNGALHSQQQKKRCLSRDDATDSTQISCQLPKPGDYEVVLASGEPASPLATPIAQFLFQSR